LGTSSIMAGAVLACLARLEGRQPERQALFDEVLCLEQMLTTGGGWQDQAGGLTGGIKLLTSAPGLPQRVCLEPVEMADGTREELSRSLLLLYTGQQRLAKNILRAVMGRWLARDPAMVSILGDIAKLALGMRGALAGGDLDGLGTLLGDHWALNKRMDPGCTNPFIDDLFARVAPFIRGGKLAGAGGGGFALMLARSPEAVPLLRELVAAHYPGTSVALWHCIVPDEGLRVSSLP
jgi:fucokinase